MDEKELQAVSEAMEQLRQGGTVSAETLQKLGGNTQAVNKALAGYTQKLLGATGSIAGMGKAVADGEGSFKSLGSSITGLTGMIGNLASAIPLVGGAAKALAEGVGQAAKFVLDQLDTMARNYQTLGDASAGAVDGLDGLYRQFTQMGNYSLPAFTKAIKANTIGMAAFQGTASEGAEEFSNIAGALTKGNIGERFLRLGMSLDGVGDAAANYVSTSARLGLLQGNSTEELTKKTQNYIEEVDKIARLTGQTREQQQQEAQRTLINARFRAKLADMAANGQEKEAEQLRLTAEGLGGVAGEAFRAYSTGIPATKAAAKANILFGDALRQNSAEVQAGKQATAAIGDVMIAGAKGAEIFNATIRNAGDVFEGSALQALDYQQIIRAGAKKGLSPQEAVAAAQKKQATASGALTEDFTKASMSIANSSKNLQELGFTLAISAVPAVQTFAEGLESVTEFINDRFGGLDSKKDKAQDQDNWNNMKFGSKAMHGAALSIEWLAGGISKDFKTFLQAQRTASETKEFGTTGAGTSANAETALKFFQSAGWTKEQAAGIVGNLQAESGRNLDTNAVGDNGKAQGIAQWHPDRQANFQQVMGKDLKGSTLEEQLKFVDWELKNTERSAGLKLRAAKTAAQAAQLIDKEYERSSGEALVKRMANANALVNLAGPTDRRQSDINKIDASVSAGKSTQDKADQTAQNTQSQKDNNIQIDLAETNSLLRKANKYAKQK